MEYIERLRYWIDDAMEAQAELATLRAENERMRDALGRLEKIGDKTPIDIGLVALIAKEALK